MRKRVRRRGGELSPFVILRLQASRRPDAPALVARASGRWETQTWAELLHVVETVAAGLLRSGIRADQVALLAMSAGARTFVLELALRSIGVVPVRVDPHRHVVGPADALSEAPVGLVAVDALEQVEALEAIAPGSAELVVSTAGDGWEQLLALGRAVLRQDPDAVVMADQRVAPGSTRPRILTHDGQVVSIAPTGAAPGVLLTSGDTVVLQSRPHEAFADQMTSAALGAGSTLCWIGDPEDVAAALVDVRPTVLALEAANSLDSLLVAARIGDHPWHAAPTEVLDAVAAVASGGRLPRGARRRAGAIADLLPWFGGELNHLMLASAPSPRVSAAFEALGIDVDEDHSTLETADLPVRPVSPRGDPATLPRRTKGGIDEAFTLHAQPEPPAGDAPHKPALPPLLGGEPAQGRVPVNQARNSIKKSRTSP